MCEILHEIPQLDCRGNAFAHQLHREARFRGMRYLRIALRYDVAHTACAESANEAVPNPETPCFANGKRGLCGSGCISEPEIGVGAVNRPF